MKNYINKVGESIPNVLRVAQSKEVIQDNRDISYYLGSIQTNAKEIHYKNELEGKTL